jgi:putative Ca2+/H+ antiporter (TMEM165/GDT1 family)
MEEKMIHEFIKTFILIFVAEMGDKTQILLMTCAARYSIIQVLFGIIVGVALNHGLAIIIGTYISNIINFDLLQIFAGIIFIVFGLLTLKVEKEDTKKSSTLKCGPILAVAITFFIGELGDKTQLTAMTIAMESSYPFLVLIGSIAGMIVVGCVGIIIGTALTKRIPSYIIKMISGLVFIIFGLIKLFNTSNAIIENVINQGIIIVTLGFISLFLITNLIINR